MSNSDTQLGWFVMLLGEKREALCHRCAKCQSLCGDGAARAFCCGQWKTPPKAGFWSAAEIPRLPYVAPRGVVTLPGKDVRFTD
jgi:hypothetical protein